MACIPSPNRHLFTTPHGSVHRCPCCGDYEVRFHDAALTMSRAELKQFRASVEAACEAVQHGPSGWQLRARTPRQTATFTLWNDDAEELAALLDGALAMLALDALLADTLGVHLHLSVTH